MVEAPPEFVLRTLSPQKLFRRSFLDEHGLRFPEGKVRLEDGIFTSRAYLLAGRVSLLADYDHYYKRRRAEGKNISFSAINPAGYVRSLVTISDGLRELCPDPDLADELVLGIYARKGLRRLRPTRFLTYKPKHRSRWVNAMAELTDAHIPRALQQRLPTKQRLLSEFVRRRDVPAVTAISTSQGSGKPLKAVKTPLGLRLLLNGRAERARELRGLVEADDEELAVEPWHTWMRRRVVGRARRHAGRVVRKLRPAAR